jgi:hypothetical protein
LWSFARLFGGYQSKKLNQVFWVWMQQTQKQIKAIEVALNDKSFLHLLFHLNFIWGVWSMCLRITR